ncbi:hypothetical protein V866_006289 [Kwoniella sp. B9012]
MSQNSQALTIGLAVAERFRVNPGTLGRYMSDEGEVTLSRTSGGPLTWEFHGPSGAASGTFSEAHGDKSENHKKREGRNQDDRSDTDSANGSRVILGTRRKSLRVDSFGSDHMDLS